MNQKTTQRLLYDPQFEHDACGVGFVADISGRKSHRVLETAILALTNLSHRGAVDADGKTGDGAGILTQLPRKILLKEVEKLGYERVQPADLAAGILFLPEDPSIRAACKKTVEMTLERYGLLCFGWRSVPINPDALGSKAASTAPVIRQVLVGRGHCQPFEFEQTLYLARKEVERNTRDVEGFYVPSLSSLTVVYKGLMAAGQLKAFYCDLSDPDFETALAVFHQRYSTNTFPNWFLAQPFRMLAHNGEINTLTGNRNWMRARESDLRSKLWGRRMASVTPVIWSEGSDSASLDNALELLTRTGRDPLHSMMMLVPEPHENMHFMDPAIKGFYEYAACLMEPWDGPAALAFSDGRFVGAALDRNGLRPARYSITNDGFIVMASEVGAVDLDPESIVEKGRLGPGRMIAVDTKRGLLLRDDDIKSKRATRKPYADWVRRWTTVCPPLFDSGFAMPAEDTDLTTRMKSFGYTVEDLNRIIEPMFSEGKEPVGSMGDDTPLAVMSSKPRSLYNYFKQRFAQVTNPAIDPIRERSVMSLETLLGARGNLLDESQSHARLIKLSSPILTDSNLEWLRSLKHRGFSSVTLAALFGSRGGEHRLRSALEALCERAVASVDAGAAILILSDRGVSELQAPIPMLLAVSAVHRRLIEEGKRMKASLVVETGEAREDHHFACLIGYGASAVNPYLAFEVVAREVTTRGMSIAGALRNYKMAVESGLLKIMAKMGIATVASYCGAQVFEAVGLEAGLVEDYFTGTASRIGGSGFDELARDVMRFHDAAYASAGTPQLEDAGFYRYRSGGEYHTFNPPVFRTLQKAAKAGDSLEFERYRIEVDARPPAALRDLLAFKTGRSIAIDEVEPIEKIVSRFSTSGMSHGALSKEAHETLAIAMNRLGAKSNSGEGGEDPRRFHPHANGNSSNSRIKQVASARFGVTPEYLVSADELEIKISQGSKPGEGGQLPGHKVSAEIAAIRHSVPGVTLISPPPHHDIYSIEDIAQLIYDLKQINPRARVAVKLVSEAGVGTVAAGVTKAFADVVHISGHDGGTGASPLGSIKNAGTPWELGLAETQQVLVLNNLRGRVRLRVDGGLKTARDVVVAAMLGAEEFGFASAAVVALGCVMARQCHLNTCPVGIATQAAHLRAKFPGHPEMVINFLVAIADDVRRILAELGYRTLEEVVGRSDLLVQKREVRLPKGVQLDLEPVLGQADPSHTRPRHSVQPRNHEVETSLNDRVLQDAQAAVTAAKPIRLDYEIRNTHRTIGARVAGKIARVHRDSGLEEGLIDLTFRGSAGQSFGAFTIKGMRLTLIGDANDYVGKGMGGGEIIIRPPEEAKFTWSDSVIIGNTVMYGATGGFLFAAGRAGERFCVRNSGGTTVVEGVGDHGCEYMTAGTVVVLGETGRNFAAGMTGGVAYVLDEQENFQSCCNHDLVELVRVESEVDVRPLRDLITRHHDLTGSLRAREVLWRWDDYSSMFWKVVTQGAGVGSVQVRGAGAGTGSDVAVASEPLVPGTKRKLG